MHEACDESQGAYEPQQTVLATDNPYEADAWVRKHTSGGVDAVALDCEWVPDTYGVALVQIATSQACLLAHRHAVESSDALLELLRDPAIELYSKLAKT